MSKILRNFLIISPGVIVIIIFIVWAIGFAKDRQNNNGTGTANSPYPHTVSNYDLPVVFEHEIDYELVIKTNNYSVLSGSVKTGYTITIQAGDVIDVCTKANGTIMDSNSEIWFIIDDMDFGNYTADDFGYKIACDYRTKWLNVPSDATGMFSIYILDEIYNKIVTKIGVTVTPVS